MLTPEYKGYEGIFEYDEDSQSFFGNAIATRYRSLITIEGESPKEVIKNFKKSVDNHLESLAQLQAKATEDLEPQAIASIIEDIKYKLAGVTQGPWRWSDWQTDFGTREEEGLENKRVLEYSASRGASRGSEIHERGDEAIKVLGVEEPLDNEQDAYFISDSRQDIQTLLAIAEFLFNENQKLKAKEPPV
jgi:hypothetical protein